MNLEKEKNKDSIKLAWSELQARIRKIKLGGGKTRLEKIRKQYQSLEEKSSQQTSKKSRNTNKYTIQRNILISLVVFIVICLIIIFLLYFI